jgi:hypothetical protein
MKITIQGQDYSTALDAAYPLTIERKLNEPSVCQLWISLPVHGSLETPARNQSLSITGDDGTTYFTGYIAVTPMPQYVGLALEGARYRIAIQALSDEMLLDQAGMTVSQGAAGETAATLLTTLVARTGITGLSTRALTLNTLVSEFAPDPGAPWSKSAGQVASQARAAYRAMNGALALNALPGTVHTLNETDGSLNLASLDLTAGVRRALANDVTVCGEQEPVAYVTEYFLGDGVTTQFYLAADPYCLPASKATLIRELFNASTIDPRLWGVLGGNGYLSLGASGLTMQGGNGIDGETRLTWLDQIEMGGTLLLEATGVTLATGSTGVVAGFFVGLETQAACTAGFQVNAQQGTGAVTVQPLIQGVASGMTYAINPANQYAFRIRMHCNENERALAIYRSYGDGGAVTYGGQTNAVGGFLQFEIQEFVNGVAGMPVTLYDGSIASLPAACSVLAASSINLLGTMRALNLTNLGSGWVVSTPPNGTQITRRVGTTAQAAECHIESSGTLAFYTGYAPPVGEQIAVSYRTVGRAVGRQVNAAGQQALAQAGMPPVCAWIGSVTSPAARSSPDCRNAAQTMVQGASGVTALWSGKYRGTRASFAADVWPGDALALNAPSTNLNAEVIVRNVKVSYRASYPDLIEYAIAFANDWADDLAIKTSSTVPMDTWLPAAVNPTMPANLNALVVTAMSGNAVTINTGVAAPSGGGFEIRRRDFAFMPGEDPDLVLRGSQSTMTFTRVTASDRFYIRVYDGATPPNYSEFSAALFINLPLGSGQ